MRDSSGKRNSGDSPRRIHLRQVVAHPCCPSTRWESIRGTLATAFHREPWNKCKIVGAESAFPAQGHLGPHGCVCEKYRIVVLVVRMGGLISPWGTRSVNRVNRCTTSRDRVGQRGKSGNGQSIRERIWEPGQWCRSLVVINRSTTRRNSGLSGLSRSRSSKRHLRLDRS